MENNITMQDVFEYLKKHMQVQVEAELIDGEWNYESFSPPNVQVNVSIKLVNPQTGELELIDCC